MMIGIVAYGLGNIRSIANALDAIAVPWQIVSDAKAVADCSHLILPGVGAFAYGMQQLQETDLLSPILSHLQAGKPFLGICLGMQLLFDVSFENGETAGLGVIAGKVATFASTTDAKGKLHKIHVGWNDCAGQKQSSYELDHSFYFTHGCYCRCEDSNDVLALSDYGLQFPAAIERGNILGVQFHPEKSHRAGLQLLTDFGNKAW